MLPEYIKDILSGCMEENREDRFGSADLLSERLQILEKQLVCAPTVEYVEEKNNIDRNYINNPTIISFAGTQSRIGTSVLAMAFTEYLVRQGVDALYEEHNDTGMVRKIVRKDSSIKYHKGNFYYLGIPMRPVYYSKRIKLETPVKVIIRDEGVYEDQREYGNRMVLVAGTKYWEEDYTISVARSVERWGIINPERRILWILNMTEGSGERKYMSHLGISGLTMPYLSPDTKALSDILFGTMAKQLLGS